MCRKWIFFALLASVTVVSGSCRDLEFIYQRNEDVLSLIKIRPPYPEVRFIVLSDLHYYDRSLGDGGKAFQEYLDSDRKLLLLSEEIMSSVVKEVSAEKADFVIVCGDLTKDGEEINHKIVVKKLTEIAVSGKKVFVIPGNHDIANGKSVRYAGEETEPVKSISGDGFSALYHNFGYGHAIERDVSSLSYVVEPVPGLWLLALDSCRWKENMPIKDPVADGAFSKETLNWIEGVLIRSKKENKAVLSFMHHGLLEHYPSNEKYYPQYLVEDYADIAKMFARYNASLVFTGHFHAQDITMKKFKEGDGFVFDIETGSLVTYPCPYRIVKISKNQVADIQSRFVSRVKSHQSGFRSYSERYVFAGTVKRADIALKGYKIGYDERKVLSPQIARAYIAHLRGDEAGPETALNSKDMGLWARFIVFMQKDLIEGWWTDLPPQDNFVKINLINGDIVGK